MDDYTAASEYYTSGDVSAVIGAGLAETGGADVPTSSWADGLKSAFQTGADAITFGINTARDLATLKGDSQTYVATNNNRNQAAIVESRRAISAAQAAPTFGGGFDLGGLMMPLLLLAGVVLVARLAR